MTNRLEPPWHRSDRKPVLVELPEKVDIRFRSTERR
jgi:hypothetical protein